MALSEHRLIKLRGTFPLLAAHKQHNDWLHQLPGLFYLREIEASTRVDLLKSLFLVSRTKFKDVVKRLKLAFRRFNSGVKNPPPEMNLISLHVAGLPIVIPVLIPRHLGRFRYFITSPPFLLLSRKYHYAKFDRFS